MPNTKRIVEGIIKKDYSEGQTLPSVDVNTANALFEQGINMNFQEIQEVKAYAERLEQQFTKPISWKTSVDYFYQIATTYPNPEKNDAVAVLSDGKVYLFDGFSWGEIFTIVPVDLDDLDGGEFGQLDIDTVTDGGTF